ncbi:MAG: ankyrin repeat domain-containing protein [Alphaproteobacteria bacterium]|nr:ankyrin repeat domain-containing protein [Alphaproteobacteria bacterium]
MLELLVNRRPNLEARECLGNTPFRTALYAIRAQKELSFYDSTTAVQEELDSSYLTSADQICAFLAFLGVNTKPVCEEDKNEIEGSEFLSGFLSDINPLIKKKEGVHFKRFVEILIENQVSLEIKDKNGNTPLAIAAQNGFIESIDLLISAGADINSVNNAGETPLLIALRNNSEAAAILLISRGADVKVHDKFGQTALHYAMSHNLVSISASLINSNVDINAVNSDGDTPLFMAVKNKSVAALKVLTEREGIDVNSTDKHRVAPLFYAISQAKQGDTSNEIEEILIKKGAVFPKDLAAAERFAKLWSEFSISKNKLKGFYARAKEKQYPRPILPPKENFKKPGSADSKKTALTVSPKIEKENFSSAISQPNDSIETTSSPQAPSTVINQKIESTPQTSSTAVDQKVELEKRESDLLKTLEETDKALAELIKEKGKDAAFADMPLLSYAVSTNNFILAELMLLIGADPTVKNAWGDTLLHMAAQKNSVEMVRLLLDFLNINEKGNYEFDCTALYQAIYYGSLDVVRFLMEHGANVNIRDSHGTFPIIKAAERGYIGIIELLLEHGADINSQDGNKQTALHRAAYNGQIDTMSFLLQRGASFDMTNSYGETPLFSASAALSNSADAVSVLLNYNAESQLNMRNTRGMTPLHKTFQFGNKDSTTLLLESGAKPDIKDRWGRMPHQAMIPPDIFNRASQGTEVGNSDLRFFPSFGKMPY